MQSKFVFTRYTGECEKKLPPRSSNSPSPPRIQYCELGTALASRNDFIFSILPEHSIDAQDGNRGDGGRWGIHCNHKRASSRWYFSHPPGAELLNATYTPILGGEAFRELSAGHPGSDPSMGHFPNLGNKVTSKIWETRSLPKLGTILQF